MAQYLALNKIIKKGKKIESPYSLIDYLNKYIASVYNENIARELYFVSLYYGLIGTPLTLENIGKSQPIQLTRERVRQIIDGVLSKTKIIDVGFEHPFIVAKKEFLNILGNKQFLRIEDLTQNDFFKDFRKNTKGLISLLNDCDIRQIAYRKQYYFYPKELERKKVVSSIQKENKTLRREKTVSNMSKKSKTVTYVPNEVRKYLLEYSYKYKLNLNPLYESIINKFIEIKPYESADYNFSKTKSWKARKGKAEWQQIGIYIDRNIFLKIKDSVIHIKKDLKKNVSLMSFICQAFVWHYETNNR